MYILVQGRDGRDHVRLIFEHIRWATIRQSQTVFLEPTNAPRVLMIAFVRATLLELVCHMGKLILWPELSKPF